METNLKLVHKNLNETKEALEARIEIVGDRMGKIESGMRENKIVLEGEIARCREEITECNTSVDCKITNVKAEITEELRKEIEVVKKDIINGTVEQIVIP